MSALLALLACSETFEGKRAPAPELRDSASPDTDDARDTDDTDVGDTDVGDTDDTDAGDTGAGDTDDTDVGPDTADTDVAPDTDADGDGAPATIDCDDDNPTVRPGAREVWYDGADQGCDGGDDYDQDGDGERAASGGGEDCDDTDATVRPAGHEALYDAVDSDCSGDVDGPRFTALDTFGSTGTQGPRLAEITGYVLVTWLGDGMRYAGTPLTSAAGLHSLATSDLRSGPAMDTYWEWGSGYTFDTGLDFWASDDHWVWAYGVRAGGTRYLVGDSYVVAAGAFGNTVLSRATSQTYDDVELVADTDDSLHIVGCDAGGGYLGWLHGSPAELHLGAAVGWEQANVLSDTCGALLPSDLLLASSRSAGTLGAYAYSDATGLSYSGMFSGWNAYDLETLLQDGAEIAAAAEGADGVFVEKAPDTSTLPAADARQVDVAMDSTGRLHVVVADAGTTAWLYWGEPATGFSRVELATGLAAVDDVAVHVATGDEVVIAVRGGDELVYGVVSAR
jgi:hypothetical protein